MLVRERVEVLLTLAEGQTLDEVMEKLPDEYKRALDVAKHHIGNNDAETHRRRADAWSMVKKHFTTHGSEQGRDYARLKEKASRLLHKQAAGGKFDPKRKVQTDKPHVPNEGEAKKMDRTSAKYAEKAAKRDTRWKHIGAIRKMRSGGDEFEVAMANVKKRREAGAAAKKEKAKRPISPEAAERIKAAMAKGAKLTPPSKIKSGSADISKRESEANQKKAPDTAE
jgi:hypothetical protein